jgi:hypothetical protein
MNDPCICFAAEMMASRPTAASVRGVRMPKRPSSANCAILLISSRSARLPFTTRRW